MSNLKNFNQTPSKYKNEAGPSGISDGKIYIGIVKNNVDPQRMGRLEVWIPEMGGQPNDTSRYFIVSYASPFAGVTPPNDRIPGSQTYDGSQQSYGWWAVPPDVDNQVLVCFANGDHTKGFWFACILPQNMNHMIPGVAVDQSFENNPDNSVPPVVEYNKSDPSVNPQNPTRPRFDPLALGLQSQGLTTDYIRGSASSSARRESPSQVFGMLSPRANQMYIDDDTSNEFIRLRTRSGTQVLVHETNGLVYINSGLGNSWVEISDSGVNVYSSEPISFHGTDINFQADNNINIAAGANVNVISGANTVVQSGALISMSAATTLQLFSQSDMTAMSQGQFLVTSTGNLALTSSAALNIVANGGDVNFGASGNMITSAGGNHTTQAGTIIRQGNIQDNSGATNAAVQGNQATQPAAMTTSSQTTAPGGVSVQTPSSVVPTHEPWAGHPKAKPAAAGLPASLPAYNGSSVNTPVSTGNSVAGQGTTVQPAPIPATTGDGKQINQTVTTNEGGVMQCGPYKISATVYAALKQGSQKSGCSLPLMMGICAIESAFKASASAEPSSSATGLFQFINSTWAGMIKQYSLPSTLTATDPYDNAYVGGLFTANNIKLAQNALGRAPNITEVYFCHFMGSGAGPAMLRAWAQNQNTTFETGLGKYCAGVCKANPTIATPSTTVGTFYNHFYQKFTGSGLDQVIQKFISANP